MTFPAPLLVLAYPVQDAYLIPPHGLKCKLRLSKPPDYTEELGASTKKCGRISGISCFLALLLDSLYHFVSRGPYVRTQPSLPGH